MKILHIITAFTAGGAEQMLYQLLESMDKEKYTHEIIALRDFGPMGEKYREFGIQVRTIGMRPNIPDPISFLKLRRWIKESNPDIVHCWLYHANIFGGLVAKFAGIIPVIWSIHHFDLSRKHNKFTTLLVARLGALLSKTIPEKILVCSQKAMQKHAEFGYDLRKMVFLPNGFNLDKFRKIDSAREKLHEELGIDNNIKLIGMAARFDPLKDHKNFIEAASLLLKTRNDVQFVLIGKDINQKNSFLTSLISKKCLKNQIHLLGFRTDIPQIFSGLDVGTLSSIGEAFPIVIGEMIACELPCVVTDVGDSSEIVGEYGVVVSPQNPEELAKGWEKVLGLSNDEKERFVKQSRMSIIKKYSISDISNQYSNIYNSFSGM